EPGGAICLSARPDDRAEPPGPALLLRPGPGPGRPFRRGRADLARPACRGARRRALSRDDRGTAAGPRRRPRQRRHPVAAHAAAAGAGDTIRSISLSPNKVAGRAERWRDVTLASPTARAIGSRGPCDEACSARRAF